MTTAFVLSGGASLGAVQVGMLLALTEAGVQPDLLVGTSVGALNAAWVAERPDRAGAEKLADIWRGIRRKDVFPGRPVTGLRGFIGRADHLVPADRVRSILRRHLTYERLEDAPVPLHVVVTEMLTGREVVLSRGDAVDAITASAAIPAVFPPVRIDGIDYVDGGISNNTPISDALELGADTVWVLPTGHACALQRPPRSALGVALHAITLLVHQRLAADIARYLGDADLRVVPPLCPMAVSPADFGHTGELIDQAYAQTRDWLSATGAAHGADADFVELHPH